MGKKFLISVSVIFIAIIGHAEGKEYKIIKHKSKIQKPAIQQPMKVTNEFTWKQGESAKPLGIKGNQGVCFLTMVTGKFEGWVEKVHVYIDGADGEWKLGGGSAQIDVSGSARCIITSVAYQ